MIEFLHRTIAFIALGMSAPATHCQVVELNDQGPFDAFLPNLKNAPEPQWAKKGFRLTYRLISATIPGSGKNWKQDDQGNWMTDDGRRWSTKEADRRGQGLPKFSVRLRRTQRFNGL